MMVDNINGDEIVERVPDLMTSVGLDGIEIMVSDAAVVVYFQKNITTKKGV